MSWRSCALGAVSLLGLGPTAVGAGDVTPLVVTTTADDLTTNGNCTLREAVQAANTNASVDSCGEGSPGEDTIQLGPGVHLLTLAGVDEDANQTGDLDVQEALVLVGLGAEATIIDGNLADRVIHAVESLTLMDLTVRRGLLDEGAGDPVGAGLFFDAADGDLVLSRVEIRDNAIEGPGEGGGAGIFASLESGSMLIDSSTIAGNTVAGDHIVAGASLAADLGSEGGPAVVQNSTFSSNVATGFDKVGVALFVLGASLDVALTHLTIAHNTGESDVFVMAPTTVANSVVSGSCAPPDDVVSLGGNIESPGFLCGFHDPTDQEGVAAEDLALRGLGDNGGGTRTHALGGSSVAVDAGSAGACLPVDQRGQERIGDCDSGSYELQVLFGDGFEAGDASAWDSIVE